MTSQKNIPFHKIGKKLGFKKAELDEYIANRRTPTGEEVEKHAEVTLPIHVLHGIACESDWNKDLQSVY